MSSPFSPAFRLAASAVGLYVAAYLLTIMVHEVGHAVVSWGVGGHPIQYNTWVRNTTPVPSVMAQVGIAAAGPLVSLLQGVCLLSYARRTRRVGNWSLFWLYAGVFGLMNFLGYVMIASLAPSGDSGQLVGLLHVPAWLQWSLALLALLGLSRVIQGTGPLFLRQLPVPVQADAQQRPAGLQALLLWPWLVGSLLLVLLSLHSPPLVLLGIPLVTMVLRRAYRTALQAPANLLVVSGELQAHWAPVVAVVALAGLFRFLATGIAWAG